MIHFWFNPLSDPSEKCLTLSGSKILKSINKMNQYCISILNMSWCHRVVNPFFNFIFWTGYEIVSCYVFIFTIFTKIIFWTKTNIFWSFKELLWSLSLFSSIFFIWDSDLKIWRSRRLLLSNRLKDISGPNPFSYLSKGIRNNSRISLRWPHIADVE